MFLCLNLIEKYCQKLKFSVQYYNMKKRSKIRIFAGKIYFRIKRFLYWNFSNVNFANQILKQTLTNEIFSHQTPLLRKLKQVDEQLQINKVNNLKIAIKKLNGLAIAPGQTFSYWKLIGNPTKRKGYLPGMILFNGKVKSGIGGGLCQLSNLLYWMTLHTPLKVTERWRHGYDVFPDTRRTQPFGSGATCSYPNIDLQIYNPTKQTFQLKLAVGQEDLIGEWRSDEPINFRYEIIEKDHHIQSELLGGYSRYNNIFRNVNDKSSNKFIKQEFVTGNKAIMMYEPLLENKE